MFPHRYEKTRYTIPPEIIDKGNEIILLNGRFVYAIHAVMAQADPDKKYGARILKMLSFISEIFGYIIMHKIKITK